MIQKVKKGFTLVELVIVIAVIAILAAVLLPTFAGVIINVLIRTITTTNTAISIQSFLLTIFTLINYKSFKRKKKELVSFFNSNLSNRTFKVI